MKSKQSVRAEQLSQGSQVPSSIVLQARTYIEQKIREGGREGERATSIILILCDAPTR